MLMSYLIVLFHRIKIIDLSYFPFLFPYFMNLKRLHLQELEIEGDLPEKVSCYQGVFYNYFSIGLHLYISFCTLAIFTLFCFTNVNMSCGCRNGCPSSLWFPQFTQ